VESRTRWKRQYRPSRRWALRETNDPSAISHRTLDPCTCRLWPRNLAPRWPWPPLPDASLRRATTAGLRLRPRAGATIRPSHRGLA
jgi:hypothetical protein